MRAGSPAMTMQQFFVEEFTVSKPEGSTSSKQRDREHAHHFLFDIYKVVHHKLVSQGETVKVDFYCNILKHLRENIQQKWLELRCVPEWHHVLARKRVYGHANSIFACQIYLPAIVSTLWKYVEASLFWSPGEDPAQRHRHWGPWPILMISMWPKNNSLSKSNTEVHKKMTLNGRSAKYKSGFWLFEARSWIFSHHSCLWTADQNKQHFRVELRLCMSQHQKHKEGWKK